MGTFVALFVLNPYFFVLTVMAFTLYPYCTHTKHAFPPVGFESAIPAGEWPYAYAYGQGGFGT